MNVIISYYQYGIDYQLSLSDRVQPHEAEWNCPALTIYISQSIFLDYFESHFKVSVGIINTQQLYKSWM